MKRNIIKSLITILAAASLLTACGIQTTDNSDTADSAETQPAEEEEASVSYTSQDLYNALTESGFFADLVSLDADYMLNTFGIDTAELKNFAAGEAEDVMNADTIIILNTGSAEAAAKAAEKLTAYKERKINELKSYNPAELQKTEAAEVKTDGSFTYILICDDNDGAEEILEGYIN